MGLVAINEAGLQPTRCYPPRAVVASRGRRGRPQDPALACARVRVPLLVALLAFALAGCASPAAVDEPTLARVAEAPDEPFTRTANESGTLTATPLSAAAESRTVDVPMGVTKLDVTLTWDGPVADLVLALKSPDGKTTKTASGASPLRASVDAPRFGAWTVTVSSERAIQQAYALRIAQEDVRAGTRNLDERLVLPAKGFAEVNFYMEQAGSVAFAWRVESGAATPFNVHSHANGQVTIHQETTSAAGNGTFQAPTRQVYSLMWESHAEQETTVRLLMAGGFRMHSQTALR